MTAASTDEPIFHLALPEDWSGAFTSGEYRVSTRGLTLDDVGFIHCSSTDQVVDTANRFYGDVDQLVLLTIDPQRVPSPIVHEPPGPDVDILFPHIYGPLPVAAVNHARFWSRRPEQTWSLDTI